MLWGFGFRVKGFGSMDQGLEFRGCDSEMRDLGIGFIGV